MQLIDYQITQAMIHTRGTCPGCHEGGCWNGYHCPCEGCDCPGDNQ